MKDTKDAVGRRWMIKSLITPKAHWAIVWAIVLHKNLFSPMAQFGGLF